MIFKTWIPPRYKHKSDRVIDNTVSQNKNHVVTNKNENNDQENQYP